MSTYYYLTKVQRWFQNSRNFHVHDEENFCRSGDKVVIRQCRKLAKSKFYYVRSIVRPIGRQNITGLPQTSYEQEQLDYNAELRLRGIPNMKSPKALSHLMV